MAVDAVGAEDATDAPLEDEEAYEDEAPVALPQHSTFGSVWDSQLGVSPAARSAASGATPSNEDDEYDDEDEPKVPGNTSWPSVASSRPEGAVVVRRTAAVRTAGAGP